MTVTQALNKVYEEITGGLHAPHSNGSAIDAINDILDVKGEVHVTELGDGIDKIASRNSHIYLPGSLDGLADDIRNTIEVINLSFEEAVQMFKDRELFGTLRLILEDDPYLGNVDVTMYFGAINSIQTVLNASIFNYDTISGDLDLGVVVNVNESTAPDAAPGDLVCNAWVYNPNTGYSPSSVFDQEYYLADKILYELDLYTHGD